MNADGSGKRRLAARVIPDMRWSPDGQKIAFSAGVPTGATSTS